MSYCEIIIGSEYMVLEDNPAELTEDAAEPTENATETTISSASESKYFWDYNSTLLLISFVGSRYEDIYHPVRRKTVWDTISHDMAKTNVDVTSKCCFQKWKSLLRTYKQTKYCNSTKFQFIDQMEELMSTKGTDSDEDADNKNVKVKSKPLRSRNTVLKASIGARAAYFREKMRYTNNREQRKEKLLQRKLCLEKRTIALQEEMIELQERKLLFFKNI